MYFMQKIFLLFSTSSKSLRCQYASHVPVLPFFSRSFVHSALLLLLLFFFALHCFCLCFCYTSTAAALFSCIPMCKIGLFLFISFEVFFSLFSLVVFVFFFSNIFFWPDFAWLKSNIAWFCVFVQVPNGMPFFYFFCHLFFAFGIFFFPVCSMSVIYECGCCVCTARTCSHVGNFIIKYMAYAHPKICEQKS